MTNLRVFSILYVMNHYAKPNTTVFEKKSTVKCYNVTGCCPNVPFVTFRLGSIMILPGGNCDIFYDGEASDHCFQFGPQPPNQTKYVFEIDGHRCKNIPELLEYAKSLECRRLNLTQDEVEFMDI